MARWPFGARDTCESCKSIDVRRWHREDRLYAGQDFSRSWTCGSEPSSTIRVRTEQDAVVLIYRARSLLAAEWKAIEQRVRTTWTNCHFGGRRPWSCVPPLSTIDTVGGASLSWASCSRAGVAATGLREPARKTDVSQPPQVTENSDATGR